MRMEGHLDGFDGIFLTTASFGCYQRFAQYTDVLVFQPRDKRESLNLIQHHCCKLAHSFNVLSFS